MPKEGIVMASSNSELTRELQELQDKVNEHENIEMSLRKDVIDAQMQSEEIMRNFDELQRENFDLHKNVNRKESD